MCGCSFLILRISGNHTKDFEQDYVNQGDDIGAEIKMEGPHSDFILQGAPSQRMSIEHELDGEEEEDQLSQVVFLHFQGLASTSPPVF